MDLTVVCVKTGPKYPAEYVNRLARMVRRNLNLEYGFVCVTDDPEGITEPMLRAVPPPYPGWWAKLGLFMPRAFGHIESRVLYLDLDVVVTGSLDELVTFPTSFAMHQDFLNPGRVHASAVMVLDAGVAPNIWKTFVGNPHKFINRHKSGGDQEYLTVVHPGADLLPRRWVVSYKKDAKEVVPDDARVVCFHGKPKPHECEGWVRELWG
jgi:hypothetical protein